MFTLIAVSAVSVVALVLLCYLLWLLFGHRDKPKFYLGLGVLVILTGLFMGFFYLPLYRHMTDPPVDLTEPFLADLSADFEQYSDDRLRLQMTGKIIDDSFSESLEDKDGDSMIILFYPGEILDPTRASKPFFELEILTVPTQQSSTDAEVESFLRDLSLEALYYDNIRTEVLENKDRYRHLYYLQKGEQIQASDRTDAEEQIGVHAGVKELILLLDGGGDDGSTDFEDKMNDGDKTHHIEEEIFFNLTDKGQTLLNVQDLSEEQTTNLKLMGFILYSPNYPEGGEQFLVKEHYLEVKFDD